MVQDLTPSITEINNQAIEIIEAKKMYKTYIPPVLYSALAWQQMWVNKYNSNHTRTNETRRVAKRRIETNSRNERNNSHRYIPKDENGNPILLAKQQVNGQDIPLPDPASNGNPHTVLGGKVSKTGVVYRQSATFPKTTWPLANGQNVPWSEVHWYDHGLPEFHSNPHQHIFNYDGNNGGSWFRGEQTFYYGK